MLSIRKSLVFILLITSTHTYGQSVCEQLKALKAKTYGFKPYGFSDKQLDEKSAELDKFWQLAQKNKDEAKPCLKELLHDEQNDSFFCFDASSLLLSLDEKQEYLDVVITGIQKCDLKDLQLESYLRICFLLGTKGKDISLLTEKLISYPNAKIPLTAHAIILNSIDASLFLYNVMGTIQAETALIKAINDGNVTAKSNAAVVLNILSTKRGDSVINNLISKKQLPDSVVKFIEKDRKSFTTIPTCTGNVNRNEILNALKTAKSKNGELPNEEMICSALKNLLPEDAEIVRDVRQRTMPGLSDEGLGRYFAMTRILMAIRNK